MDGFSSQYAAGIMPATVAAHQSWGHLPLDLSQYTVFGATAVCADMGREFLVNYTGEWERGIVSDCSNILATKEWFADNQILLEVDFETAERWGITGRGGIAVQMAYIQQEIVPGSMGCVAI
jgi:hypothetical protein